MAEINNHRYHLELQPNSAYRLLKIYSCNTWVTVCCTCMRKHPEINHNFLIAETPSWDTCCCCGSVNFCEYVIAGLRAGIKRYSA